MAGDLAIVVHSKFNVWHWIVLSYIRYNACTVVSQNGRMSSTFTLAQIARYVHGPTFEVSILCPMKGAKFNSV